jgi:PAS domain S-box-containing protein
MSETTRILVVDDEPALLAATVRVLKSAGFDVLEATTGAECLEVARERRPDLVLLDVVLPDNDGREVCRELKANPALKPTLVVLVSGERKSADDRVNGLDVGADGYIVRPIGNRELLARVQAFVRICRTEAALRRAQEQIEQRHALSVAASLDGMWEWEMASGLVQYSDRFAELLSYRPDEVPSTIDFLRAIVHPDDVGAVWTVMERHLVNKTPYDVECRLERKGGEYRWFRARGKTQWDVTGRATWMAGSIQDISEQKQAESERTITVHVLSQATVAKSLHELLAGITSQLQRFSDCAAVGIRVRDGEDYPYYETRGFSHEFVQAENRLCEMDAQRRTVRDATGRPILECMCGNVLCGRFDPKLPFFTEGGAFWTNSTSELLASTTEAERQAPTRNRCNREGYESVALIPLRAGGETFGLLQFNDKRKGMFSTRGIELFERLAHNVGMAVERQRALEALRINEGRLRREVRERKQAEDALRIKEKAIASSISGIGLTDAQGTLVYVNDSLVRMWGYQRAEEILGRPLPEFWEGEGVSETVKALQEVGHHQGEDIGRRKDGSLFDVAFTASMIHDQAGKPAYMFGSFVDITQRKLAERALQRSEHFLAEAQRIAHLGNWWWDMASNQTYWSTELFCILGVDPEDTKPSKNAFLSCVHADDRPLLEENIATCLSKLEPFSIDHRVVRPDGSIRYVNSIARLDLNADNKPVRLHGVLQDITERQESQVALTNALTEVRLLQDRLREENVYLRDEIRLNHNFDEIVGQSEPLRATLSKIEHVAYTDTSVLLLGETGTGKELLARAIHDRSARRDRPLVKVNCATLPRPLIESELFGHVKGAFTGAVADQVGRFQLADKGTIFLDEIGELDVDLQTKLLRVLQEGQFERIGSGETTTVDVRLIAATNRDLHKAMSEGRFRPDLYYRLAVFPIEIPPLRLRREDIPLLAWHFVTRGQARLGKTFRSIPVKVMDALVEYDWPGNVRELENVIERSMILSPGPALMLAESLKLPSRSQQPSTSSGPLEEVDRTHIVGVLEACKWKIKGEDNAAQRLGLKPSTLRYRMKKLGIERPPRRPR